MSTHFTDWHKKNPWTITDSDGSGDLEVGDQLVLVLSGGEVQIDSVDCPMTHSTRHTGGDFKGVPLKGSGSQAETQGGAARAFMITCPLDGELDCNPKGGKGTYWTAEAGDGASGRHPKPPKPSRKTEAR